MNNFDFEIRLLKDRFVATERDCIPGRSNLFSPGRNEMHEMLGIEFTTETILEIAPKMTAPYKYMGDNYYPVACTEGVLNDFILYERETSDGFIGVLVAPVYLDSHSNQFYLIATNDQKVWDKYIDRVDYINELEDNYDEELEY